MFKKILDNSKAAINLCAANINHPIRNVDFRLSFRKTSALFARCYLEFILIR